MPLEPGTRLGPYEIRAPLGAGGMGEVYKARDTRLDRDVAIKVLPPEATGDADRRMRFDREARAIAAFSHPNVCAIFDVGRLRAEGASASASASADKPASQGPEVTFLVMEYLEGETLAARLARTAARTPSPTLTSPSAPHSAPASSRADVQAQSTSGRALPVPDSIRIGTALADALAAAHRAGIVHRDLKPGNIMLTKSGVKVLDFGLARMVGREGQPGNAAATMTAAPLTGLGMLLGTMPYMSPEQLEGKEVDARSDIFALGAVIYEMATGRRAFEGTSQASLIAAILDREPVPISELQPLAPAGLDRIVRTCLEKDPDNRWQHTGDISRQLKWLTAETDRALLATASAALPAELASGRPATTERPKRALGWYAVIAIATLSFVAYMATLRVNERSRAAASGTPPASGAIHFTVGVPGVTLTNVKVSPDGRTLALVGRAAEAPPSVWLKRLDQPRAEPLAIPGFTGSGVLWSPDGRELAASTTRGLVAVRLDGGLVRSLASGGVFGAPLDWGSSGTILGRRGTTTLRGLNAATGQTVDVFDRFFLHPKFLPDGRRLLYSGREKGEGPPDGVYLISVDTPEQPRRLLSTYSTAAYADGHLLFVRDGTLLAQRFDVDRAEVSGEQMPLVDGLHFFKTSGFSLFDASAGTIAYISRGPDEAPTWFDRTATELGRLGPPGLYGEVTISPDGTRVIAIQNDRRSGTGDLWVYDVTRTPSQARQLTNDAFSEQEVVWSPDGRSIAYRWDGDGPPDVYVMSIDGGSPRRVYGTPDVDTPRAWLAGNRLLVTPPARIVGLDGAVDESGGPLPSGIVSVSPDGRWAASISNRTGRTEVYVHPFGRDGVSLMASRNGGQAPVWAADSRSLYYRTDRSVHVVRLRPGLQLDLEPPEHLFTLSREIQAWDVMPKGDRFLIVQRPPADFLPVNVIVNWQALLR